jgi:S-formylglutathione hydrolase FrmB
VKRITLQPEGRKGGSSPALLRVFASVFILAVAQPSLRFEVTTQIPSAPGRLFVIVAKSDRPEPRNTIAEAGSNASTIFARDVEHLQPGAITAIDKTAATFPIQSLDELPAGDYYVQAFLASNRDLKSLNAPGNLYSDVQRIRINPRTGGAFKLELTKAISAEELPADDEFVKYVEIQSPLLSAFHGRPIYMRAGIVLPRDYEADARRRFPVRIHIGGYGTRYTAVQRIMAPGSPFRRMWLSGDTPSFIYVQLDGDGPYGDPYEVNSDNNGPYGDALTKELIPYIENRFRAVAEPSARVLDGESTGGWVSLALKIFYPDFFNAVWSSCPDGVDFRGFQLINIYKDNNAYFASNGSELPSKRDINGNVEFTIRHECQMENVIGAGDNWSMSGQQWGAWNAVYGPRDAGGHPIPLWDPKTGVIDKSVVQHWTKYDLRLILEQNWKTLGPKLRGKIHISVGEADNYYLNNAVHMLDDFLKKADPPADVRIAYGPGRGHCWSNLSEIDMMKEMVLAVEGATRGRRQE